MNTRIQHIGSNIRNLRLAKGWSQEELAHLANITPSHLGHIERGASNPTVETLIGISDALQVSVIDLFKDINSIPESVNSELKLEGLQVLYAQLVERQRELYSVVKTMLDWNLDNKP